MGKWLNLGSVIKAKEQDGQYLKLKDTVSVLKNGEELDLNNSRTLSISLVGGDITIADIFCKKEKIGEIKKGKEGKKNYISFEKGISFTENTIPFKSNSKNTAQLTDPVENLERLIKIGKVDESQIETRRQKTKEIASWLMYEVTIPDDTPMKK